MNIQYSDEQVKNLTIFFNNLSNSDQIKIFNTAYRRGVKPMITYAKSIVPRKTGNLAKSIGTIFIKQDIAVIVGAKKAYKGWHGHLIENGTNNRFRKSKTGTGFTGAVKGTHFMEQAYDQTINQVIESIEQSWLDEIQRYINKNIK